MNHHSGLLNVRRVAVIAFALMMAFAFTTAIAANNADAKRQKKAKVTVKIRTKNQKDLLTAKKIKVAVKSTAKTAMRVMVISGGKSNRFSKRNIRFNRARTRKFPISLTQAGRKNLSTCGAKTIKVVAKYSKYRRGKKVKKSSRKKKLAKSSAACPAPPQPVKVDVGPNPERCDWFDLTVCLQPFANDYYTKSAQTDTGVQLDINPESTPVNTGNPNPTNLSVTDINRGDGFSPGNMITLKIPGLDNPTAVAKSGLVPLNDISAYKDADQAVMVINADTGERQPIWAELDANPTTVDPVGDNPGGINRDPKNTEDVNLLIRPAKNFDFGQRYIVAFRNLKDAKGNPIAAPTAFEVYRDNEITDQQIVEDRRPHMESVINDLTSKAGVDRSSLYMAWDFTVASEQSVTGRAVQIRDEAYAHYGDTNLADRKVQAGSTSPDVVVSAFCDFSSPATPDCGNNYPFDDNFNPANPIQSPVPNGTTTQRTVVGYLDNVPCYLNQNGCPSGSQFDIGPDGKVVSNPAFTTKVPFRCLIPKSIVSSGTVVPGGTGTYGHGLLGSLNQINATESVSNLTNSTWCATNWDGFSSADLGIVISALGDMSNFPKMVDRMQQGFVNFMMLQRALIHPGGMAAQPAFTMDHNGVTPIAPGPAIDLSAGENTRGYYQGISQGGIMGGALTALDPDVDRGVLGVPGINYSTLLRRSVDSDEYFKLPGLGLYANYPDLASRPLLLSLIQLLWDRGEGNGFAHNMTDNPLPGTNPHEVLLRLALGDHQVSNFAAEVEARTIGAQRYSPTLLPARTWDDDYEGIPPIPALPAPAGNSFMVYYDGGPPWYQNGSKSGSGLPPLQNVPPRPQWGYGDDPHGYPRGSVDGNDHGKTFLLNGTIGACAGVGGYCYSNNWDGSHALEP
ncbi:MAG: hypothetical protein IPK93_07270 [Solirubrobacterales bacterium]|nr:hypothetical protein [Solirubrobacterales bacterium]